LFHPFHHSSSLERTVQIILKATQTSNAIMSNNQDKDAVVAMEVDKASAPEDHETEEEPNKPTTKRAAPVFVTNNSSNDTATKSGGRQQLPWVEKYRPERLEDLVAQDDIVSILTNLIDSENLPHLLLYGRMYNVYAAMSYDASYGRMAGHFCL
jgi:hypothetical protein